MRDASWFSMQLRVLVVELNVEGRHICAVSVVARLQRHLLKVKQSLLTDRPSFPRTENIHRLEIYLRVFPFPRKSSIMSYVKSPLIPTGPPIHLIGKEDLGEIIWRVPLDLNRRKYVLPFLSPIAAS